ncbi:family 16 glycosylhydrolase [uncultured Ferrimonas sp.]|uniref:family 16 glycosylhydrolase n=1 Tax=uncultured Ferrimonas sp. TaxID=432640 RepID=UPI00262DE15C|nr:family 16 glycosylhydrolase [uncultured Ferrimonas sp.]
MSAQCLFVSPPVPASAPLRHTVPVLPKVALALAIIALLSSPLTQAEEFPLTALDGAHWHLADGWSNGSPFANGWAADAVHFDSNGMVITLDDTSSSGKPYRSGELRSNHFYGYGCYAVDMQPASHAGVISAFFTFAGPYDVPSGGNAQHNEIDIEFVGSNTSYMQANFWANDDGYANSHEHLIPLPFDAAAGFHRYGFKWTEQFIEWYVDGQRVYRVDDSATDPLPKASDTTQRIMMNLWPVDYTAEIWAGAFVYPAAPLTAAYRNLSYRPGANCNLDSSAISASLATLEIQPTRNSKRLIVTATIVDDRGQPLENVELFGQWQGDALSQPSSGYSNRQGKVRLRSDRVGTINQASFCVTEAQLNGERTTLALPMCVSLEAP